MFKTLQAAFEPEKSFFQLRIVINTIKIVLGFALISIILIVCNTNLSITFHYEGFNNLFQIFKFPISVIALLIPLLAVYAANHRSEQTKHNLLLLAQQNNFNNYYKHIEVFKQHVTESNNHYVSNRSYRKLHSLIFPKTSEGMPTYSPSLNFLNEIDRRLIVIIKHLDKLNDASSFERARNFVDVSESIKQLRSYLTITMKNADICKVHFEGHNYELIAGGDLKEILFYFNRLVKYLDTILNIGENYSTPSMIEKCVSIKPGSIPPSFNHSNLKNLPTVKIFIE
ncbi:hypothetical protein [uncultured Paraglaciecola sp.]|uniref:hypothetical protein n=1 Tax=uncultured Paraglaciecola sp. TaxID=1765024 RepID=UPI00259AAB79|nr:hypothetical protein [uncultured Paraglaciecola sp.]